MGHTIELSLLIYVTVAAAFIAYGIGGSARQRTKLRRQADQTESVLEAELHEARLRCGRFREELLFARQKIEDLEEENAILKQILQSGTAGRSGPSRLSREDRALHALGISKAEHERITHRIVRSAYIKKMKEVHPDVGGTAEGFKHVQSAYEYLVTLYPEN